VRPQASLRSRLGVRFSLAREMLARRGRKMASGRILAASVATPQRPGNAARSAGRWASGARCPRRKR